MEWLKTKDFEDEPQFKDVSAYGVSWCTWWDSVQSPLRRRLVNQALPEPKYDHCLVQPIRKGGEGGVVNLLLGLFWWGASVGQAEDTSAELKKFTSAVGDFHLCIESLLAVEA